MIGTIILFIVILGILVFSHELGHFMAAKRLGTGVEEFGFGFPPRLIGIQRITGEKLEKISETEKIEIDMADIKTAQGEIITEHLSDTKKEVDKLTKIKKWKLIIGSKEPKHTGTVHAGTIYSLNWIPVGGFVKIKGEQGNDRHDRDSFVHKKIWQRAVILSSGVIMNFILAFVIMSIGFMIGLPSMVGSDLPRQAHVSHQSIQIAEVQKGSPADQAGLQMGDFIVSVDRHASTNVSDFQAYTKPHLNQPISIVVKRANEEITKTVTPTDLNKDGQGLIGTWLVETGTVSYPWYYAIWMGIKTTLSITWQIVVAFFLLLKNLIVTQHVSADIAGPVGIAALTGQVAKMGFIYILQFTALLSINLAIINFMPFPALDGGRVLFLIIEKIRGKAVNQRIENLVHNIGFAVLLTLVALITFRDVAHLSINFKSIFSNIF
jgi:regulator of sigma E protease